LICYEIPSVRNVGCCGWYGVTPEFRYKEFKYCGGTLSSGWTELLGRSKIGTLGRTRKAKLLVSRESVSPVFIMAAWMMYR
jgi:hypothetical protein